jgi:hypothetical protein
MQCSAVQYSAVQYSTVQYSTVQYSTVQYSTHELYVSSRTKYSVNELFSRLPFRLFNYPINYVFNLIAISILFTKSIIYVNLSVT